MHVLFLEILTQREWATASIGPALLAGYLRQHGRLRRFAPHEIARLMGLGEDFRFGEGLDVARRYQQVGNAVHVGCVRQVLSWVGA